ncbi:MAG: GNAT family N-acetyltransferase [Steroidobacteraceae bacterium]
MRERLAAVGQSVADGVMVAETDNGRVIGWLHVALLTHLTDASDAYILGLVVSEPARGKGVGTRLLREAEQWALAKGATQLKLRSGSERERAHRFYERAGFRRVKTQVVFAKSLAD